ncbi:MAG: hypothetical protein HY812_01930, partial [Planctomycetes bacterium]|nr:hypothetical protein [Planctomycetota bacterium]
MKKHVLWAALLLLQNYAFADGVEVSATNNNDGTATMTYVVNVDPGKTVKDLHWEVLDPKHKNLKAQNDSASSTPTGWSKAGTSGSDKQIFTTSGNGITSGTSAAGRTFSFTFNIGSGSNSFAKFNQSLKQVQITATNDGTDTITSGNTVFTGGPTGGPNVVWPVAYVSFQPPGGTAVASIGCTVAFRIE